LTDGAGALRAALAEAAAAVRSRSTLQPEVGIILGTGLGRLAEEIRVSAALAYEEIPHFPSSTVESHAGRLLLGELAGCPVVAMEGRFHRYEGRSHQELALPVRVMHALGARTLVVSNAAGALNPLWQAGELALLDDHINLLGGNPLIGPNLDELGPRFPDMSEPYDLALQAAAEAAALELRIPLRRGVYAAVTGPALETRAEYRMLRTMGADMVGMSTVPEVIAARHAGMRVLGVSVLTDRCLPDALEPVTLEEIIAVADAASPALTALVSRVVGARAGRMADAGGVA
jgi:purine-nucleoside phosphorylase